MTTFGLKDLESRLPTANKAASRSLHLCRQCGAMHWLDERVYRFGRLIRLLNLVHQCPHCHSTWLERSPIAPS